MERLLITMVEDLCYDVVLERTGETLVRHTKSPIARGAAALLSQGRDAGTLLTMRVTGRDHDAYVPCSIGDWAKSSADSTAHPLRRVPWVPLPHESSGA